MIDARDHLSSSAPAAPRRLARPSTAARSRLGQPAAAKSLPIERVFSDPKTKPFDQIEWEKRTDALARGIQLPEYVFASLYRTGRQIGIPTDLLD